MPETTFSAFMDYQEMRDKSEHNRSFSMKSHEDRLLTLAHFGAFTEGLQLFAAFAVLMNFPRFGKMKGMGQIVSWSVRDESLHCDGIIRLFHAYAAETGALTDGVRGLILQDCLQVVAMEDRLVDLIFEAGPVRGITPEDVKGYIRFIADWRLRQLGLEPAFGVMENPLTWLQSMLSGVEHSNFFETPSTEYSKASSAGTWQDTWERFESSKGDRT
jgi:ribonucleoside-diphosphate reductase beta chain